MVDDLLGAQLWIGRSQQEIEDLLGKPDLDSVLRSGERVWHYSLGSQKDYPARSILFLFPGVLQNVELWVLELRFQDGRLCSAQVVPA